MSALFKMSRFVALAVVALLSFGGAVQAQGDVETTFWAYFSPDATTVITIGELTSSDPSLAAELVSPQYADQFFDGFTIFTDYDFASLSNDQSSKISEADEYMVFAGTLDGLDGPAPGLVMFLSTNQEVFLLYGYERDSLLLFDLAEQTIATGDSPETFLDYTRINTTELGDGETDNSSGESTSNGGYSDDVGRIFCANDPVFEPFDIDGDGFVTQYELSQFADLSADIDELLQTMVENGFDSIQVANCTPVT